MAADDQSRAEQLRARFLTARPGRDNVVAFPAPSGRRALSEVLKRFVPSQAMQRHGVDLLLEFAGSDQQADRALRIAADHLAFVLDRHRPHRVHAPSCAKLQTLFAMAASVIAEDGTVEREPSGELVELVDDDDDDIDPGWAAMITVALRYPALCTPWEWQFLNSVRWRKTLSERQRGVLEGLYARAVADVTGDT